MAGEAALVSLDILTDTYLKYTSKDIHEPLMTLNGWLHCDEYGQEPGVSLNPTNWLKNKKLLFRMFSI